MATGKPSHDVMNYKRHNPHGALRRKARYKNWSGKKAFKVDVLDKKQFNKCFLRWGGAKGETLYGTDKWFNHKLRGAVS